MTDRQPGAVGSMRRGFRALPEWVHPATRLIHGARREEFNAGSVVPPIYQSSTFHYPAEFSEASDPRRAQFYTRLGNPTQEVACELVRELEGAEEARVFGSGMGALTTTLLTFLRPGDEVVALEELYGGTLDLVGGLLPRLGVRVRWVSPTEARAPERVVTAGTRLALVESPTNPLLRVHDLRRWAEAMTQCGGLLVVDNTFATPINQNPLAVGADLVVHSGTKYLGGHADLLAGAVAGPAQLVERIDSTHHVVGSVLDPFAAFLLVRGLRTLEIRVGRQNLTGAYVARSLVSDSQVESVHYPGFGDDDQERIAALQMRGRGGMVSLDVQGGADAARAFLHRLRLFHVASSLGGVESLASMPAETSHRHLDAAELARRGVRPGTVRLSLGLEDPEDLVRDLTEALAGS
ncbi:MAG TPA: aminotransferase class I/II-fold pyridoxal phosphate-dependent enzyme [Thermoplasmata archaeon]|nr:aminotransferase class I/II-fold pyridoxal phosphate-dependent enzyme [Thermoplasmata archaeon]